MDTGPLHDNGKTDWPRVIDAMAPLRVLIAEDEAVIALLLRAVLEGMGHRVCAIAATQAKAVAEAARWKPELMIVDAHLGRGSGVTAVNEILRTRFIPHVFVTGDVVRVRAQCPDAVILQKPFAEPELEIAIKRALAVQAPDPARITDPAPSSE